LKADIDGVFSHDRFFFNNGSELFPFAPARTKDKNPLEFLPLAMYFRAGHQYFFIPILICNIAPL
jgi:hypothetical protein